MLDVRCCPPASINIKNFNASKWTTMRRSVCICEMIGILGLFHRFDVLQVGPPRNIEKTLPWHGRMDANKDLQDKGMKNMA